MNLKELSLAELIEGLLAKLVATEMVAKRDVIYYRNQCYQLLNLNPVVAQCVTNTDIAIVDMVTALYEQLSDEQRDRLGETRDIVEARIINTFIAAPSYIETKVKHLWDSAGSKLALDWYYQFSQDTNYIKTRDIARNESWLSHTNYGDLEITINLSKPEKDPLEIARAKLAPPTTNKYPTCLLCVENEGYAGSFNQPARATHRMLQLSLNNRDWFFQYSPYAYYTEHAIIINHQHCDMIINADTFKTFFDFVDMIPHYMIGSNTDIPIVGGSILTHDHYQAGNYVFPFEHATIKASYVLSTFPQVELNYLKWPITTLQLIGGRADLQNCIMQIINHWYGYSNPDLGIYNYDSNGIRHNAITPILRKVSTDKYIAYLMLRNNRTSNEHPEGIFHPHRHLHHIKKENIGLIEAMGLAILPGRLKGELLALSELLLSNDLTIAKDKLSTNSELQKHSEWLDYLFQKYSTFTESTVHEILRHEVGMKFVEVLECAGVFKHTPAHDEALKQFIETI